MEYYNRATNTLEKSPYNSIAEMQQARNQTQQQEQVNIQQDNQRFLDWKRKKASTQSIANHENTWDNKVMKYLPNSMDNFMLGAVKGLSEYGASASKLVGADNMQNRFNDVRRFTEQKIKKNDGAIGAFVGEMIGDPLNLTPAGLITKGTKGARVAKSMVAGAGVGGATMFAKTYGNDDKTQGDKFTDMAMGAGFVSVLNGIIAGVTKGRIDGINPNILNNTDGTPKNTQGVIDALSNNAEALGLNKNETQAIVGEIIKHQHQQQKVQPEFAKETPFPPKPYEPNFQMRPNYPPAPMTRERALDVIFRKANQEAIARGEQPLYPTKLEDYQAHPRYNELMDMRRDISAKQTVSPQVLEQKRTFRDLDGNGGTSKIAVDGATYRPNYDADFVLTKQDIAKIERGELDDTLRAKLQQDLETFHHHPTWNKENEIPEGSWKEIQEALNRGETPNLSKAELDEADQLFAMGSNTLGGALGGGTLGGATTAYEDIVEGKDRTVKDYLENIAMGAVAGGAVGRYAGGQAKGTGLFAGARAKGYDAKVQAGKTFDGKYDGMERFEIDDSKSSIKASPKELNDAKKKRYIEDGDAIREQYKSGAFTEDEAMALLEKNWNETPKGKNGTHYLNEVLEHKELFDNYPKLYDTKVTFIEMPQGRGGWYDKEANEIVINSSFSNDEIKSVLLHEIQHNIQDVEGFARGGSAQEFYNDAKNKFETLKYELEFEPDGFIRDKMFQKLQKLESEFNSGAKEKAFDMYQKLAGEIEARDVQARMDYTAPKRDEIAPYSSEDIAPEDAILRFNNANDELTNGLRQDMSPVKSKEQKEMRGIYNVQNNGKASTVITKDIDEVEASLKFEQGFENPRTKKGYGALHIDKHIGKDKDGWVTQEELMNIGKAVRNVEPYIKDGKRVYEYHNNFGDRFRVIVGDRENGENVISFFSNRRAGKGNNTLTYVYPRSSNDNIVPQMSQKKEDFVGGQKRGFFDNSTDTLERLAKEQGNKDWKDVSQNNGSFTNIKNSFKELFTDTFSGKYHEARDQVHTNMQTKGLEIERLAKILDDLDEVTDKELYRYLTGGDNNLPENIKKVADNMRKTVDDLGAELVRKGVLDEKAYKEWAGVYLHRQYEPHLNPKGHFKKGFKIDKIHERGISDNFKPNDLKKMVGWLNKNGFLKDDDLMTFGNSRELLDHLRNSGQAGMLREGKLSITTEPNGNIKFRRDFTKAEREAMGEIESAKMALPNTLMKLNRMVEHSKFLERTKGVDGVVLDGKKAKEFSPHELEKAGYLKADGVQFGALNGKWIRRDVADDIGRTYKDIANAHNDAFRIWNGYHGLFKKSVTVWNPTAHANNFGGNLFLMHLGGVSGAKLPKMLINGAKQMKAYKKLEELEVKMLKGQLTPNEKLQYLNMKESSKIVQEAKEMGVFGRSQLNDILSGMENKAVKKGFFSKLDKTAEKWYQFEDDFNRLSFYLTLRESGKDAKTAKQMIDFMLPDYSKPLPKGWRFMRDTSIAPFISWSYYTMPSIVRMLGTKEGAKNATKVIATISAMEYFLSQGEITPLDNIPFMNTNKPEDFKGRRFAIGKDGDKINTLKLDRLIPYAELQNIPNYLKSNIGGMFPNLLYTMNGSQMYNGRPITTKNKDTSDKAIDWIKHLASQYTPVPAPVMSGVNLADKELRGKERTRRSKTIEPRTMLQSLAQIGGVNTLTYNKTALKKEQKD